MLKYSLYLDIFKIIIYNCYYIKYTKGVKQYNKYNIYLLILLSQKYLTTNNFAKFQFFYFTNIFVFK